MQRLRHSHAPPSSLGALNTLRPLRGQPRDRNGPHRQVVSALADPWKTLGVQHNASEADIKRAHRRLVLEHHPDRKNGCELAQRRFMAIQEAYEFISGKHQGKELGQRPAGSQQDWEFHDWYWKFSMSRRQRRAASAEGMQSPGPMRHQWKAQVDGLKQKAAAKKMQQARQQHQHQQGSRSEAAQQHQEQAAEQAAGKAAAFRSSASNAAWRSTTKNARRQPGTAGQQATSVHGSHAASGLSHAPASHALNAQTQQHSQQAHTVPAYSAKLQPEQAASQQASQKQVFEVQEVEQPPEQLRHAVDAEHLSNSAVAVDENLRSRARSRSPLRHHTARHAQHTRSAARQHIRQGSRSAGSMAAAVAVADLQELEAEFERFAREAVAAAAAASDADSDVEQSLQYSEGEQQEEDGSGAAQQGYSGAARPRFAATNRERVSSQLAGLRRRAALKQEMVVSE